MEGIILELAIILFCTIQISTFVVVIYAWRRGMPSIRRELKRQEDANVRNLAKLPEHELPFHLQPSPKRFWMLVIASFSVWPFALAAWSMANLIGIAWVLIVTGLFIMALIHESSRLRGKVEQYRSEMQPDSRGEEKTDVAGC